MADSPNELSDRSQETAASEKRRNQTIVMGTKTAGTPKNASPESQLVRQLDKASSLLKQAESDAPIESSGGCNEVEACTGKTEVLKTANELEPTIEEYMADLIAHTEKHAPTTGLPDQRSSSVRSPQTPPSAESEPAPSEPWVQKAPPECRDAITGMRELANMNARSSFNTHQGQSLIFRMHSRLLVALVAISVSFALITFCSSPQSIQYYAAVVSLIAGCAWTVKYFGMARRLLKLCEDTEAADKVHV